MKNKEEKIKWAIIRALGDNVPKLKDKVNWGNYYSNRFGKFKYFYDDNMSYEDFKKSIIESDNYTNSLKYFKKIVTLVYNDLKSDNVDIKRKEVENHLIEHMLLQKWVGFDFEYRIQYALEQKGYKVFKGDYWDYNFAIDLIVELDDKTKIGLQCKSQFYKFGAKYSYEHYRKNWDGINRNEVNDVFYVFHDKVGEVAKMRKNFESTVLVDKEWITESNVKPIGSAKMEDLLKEIDKIKLAYIIRNCRF